MIRKIWGSSGVKDIQDALLLFERVNEESGLRQKALVLLQVLGKRVTEETACAAALHETLEELVLVEIDLRTTDCALDGFQLIFSSCL